jgi:hypothetical protein
MGELVRLPNKRGWNPERDKVRAEANECIQMLLSIAESETGTAAPAIRLLPFDLRKVLAAFSMRLQLTNDLDQVLVDRRWSNATAASPVFTI